MKVLKDERRKVSLYSNMLMVLTSVHHVYGGIIYHTPWRLHVLFLSVPVIIVTLIFDRLLRNKENNVLFWIYWFVILLASVLFMGMFEGIYNHVLKNILFFSGLSYEAMTSIFPPGMYELPNDVIFEMTGSLQGVIAIILIVYFIRLTKLAVRGGRN